MIAEEQTKKIYTEFTVDTEVTEKRSRDMRGRPSESRMASVEGGGEENAPEVGGGRSELDGDERAFVDHLRRTHDAGFNLGLRFRIFNGQLGAFRETFVKNEHGAAGADGMSMPLGDSVLAKDLNIDSDPKKDALGAAAFFRSRRTSGKHSVGGSRFGVG
jgi:hypothetical protein